MALEIFQSFFDDNMLFRSEKPGFDFMACPMLIGALPINVTLPKVPVVVEVPKVEEPNKYEPVVVTEGYENEYNPFDLFIPVTAQMERQVDLHHGGKLRKLALLKKRVVKRKPMKWVYKWQGGDHEVTHITQSIAGGPMPSEEPEVSWGAKATSKKTVKTKRQRLFVNASVKSLEGFLFNEMKRRPSLSVTYTEKGKTLKVYTKECNNSRMAFTATAHMERNCRLCVDLSVNTTQGYFLSRVASKFNSYRMVNADSLTHGSSGLIMLKSVLMGDVSSHRDHLFIVRGRIGTTLYSAQEILSVSQAQLIRQFTDEQISKEFFLSFCKTYKQNRPEIEHTCSRGVPVSKCGEVAGLLTQLLFPSGKITCLQCFAESSYNVPCTKKEFSSRVEKCCDVITQEYPEFSHVVGILQNLITRVKHNPNIDTCAEIKLLIGERTKAPFSHVLQLNELLMKGLSMTNEDHSKAAGQLLEVARFLKNRTENMILGSLGNFRNKVSAKAHINPTLMCDNQLDRNGNFVWGERGYHAKRFFVNFFDEIKPEEGYQKYVTRKCARGERELAIGNLVMSTNFETLRQQLSGKPTKHFPITEKCISKRDDNFLYSCCCVTLDDGKPLTSDVKTPTKRHLVVGNSGDAKFIDLPEVLNAGMYIAKEGYCYMNIFLAMLVNVNEAEAKDFTKFVRDTIVPKLGKWPKMIDVATACYMLRVLYPDVHNAELPRILVDHENETMHVLDSYGSLSTGYHVLKANTITQLCEFASYSLDSPMKEYRVGGSLNDQVVESTVRTLIRSIYKPKLFAEIMVDEPYLLALCVVSPSVIMAMYNTGNYEKALAYWLQKDMALSNMITILMILAQKLSVADVVTEQNVLISQHSGSMLEAIFRGTQPCISYTLALNYLMVKGAQSEMDDVLRATGFNTISEASQVFAEKNYVDLLNAEWDALSWYAKFCVLKSSSKHLKFGRAQLKLKKSVDLGAVYRFSPGQLLMKPPPIHKHVSGAINGVRNTFSKMLRMLSVKWWNCVNYFIPNMYKFVTVLSVILMLTAITRETHQFTVQMRSWKMHEVQAKADAFEDEIDKLISIYDFKHGRLPTVDELRKLINVNNKELLAYYDEYYGDEKITLQKGKKEFAYMERIIAIITLLIMAFDAERSDGVYQILNKFKGVIGSAERETIRLESSLDDICNIQEDKLMTIDFNLDTDDPVMEELEGVSFRKWWDNQLNRGNTMPHYRTEGQFIEFTRSTASQVASEISHSQVKDWLVRGAVGSGKSTGLPYHLSKKGKVLILEPTRPLANNVFKQLQAQPFMISPTLRIRGKSSFGSSPITIMTTGFALHFYAHNVLQLKEYDSVIFDECHVSDAAGIAFRNLLHEYSFEGKVLKVSATPPGREVEFTTQHPVTIKVEEALSFQEFVVAQGSCSNADVVQLGDNILVYVASYNEVDSLSKLLVTKGFMVTKVDGRTMKESGLEIVTKGTINKKHFVVATNIIENGVTLDIDVVVDFGMKVKPILDLDNRAIQYTKCEISYGERIQRLGRVGRHKSGHALRIGHTVKGLVDIPEMIATEAAFLCFMYNLPVTTQSVSTSVLEKCTLQQAKTMAQFELPFFYTMNMVRHDGSMHPAIHNILKKYKLRDCNTVLNKLAIPNKNLNSWLTTDQYRRVGYTVPLEKIKIAFLSKDVPDRVHEDIWEAIEKHKSDAGIGRLTSHQVSKVAYTLQTDVHSISRTITTINQLIANERRKQSHFEAITSKTCEFSSYSLNSIFTAIRSRYSTNHTQQNIEILTKAKDQLLEFCNLSHDKHVEEVMANFGYLETITFQSRNEVAKFLKLEGHWNKSLATRDFLVMISVAIGGASMLYSWFKKETNESISLEGKKNQRHKLKMAKAQTERHHYVVDGDEASLTHYFGSAYANKGKVKGTTRGMGHKNRRFVNMYGFDPSDFQFVRFVDPLTGVTLDESPQADISLVQNSFGEHRAKCVEDDDLSPQMIAARPGIKAYYVNNLAKKALEVDLTPHISLKMSDTANKIMGFPQRENELRQTGPARAIDIKLVPNKNEAIELEGVSLANGIRDYNMISNVLCKLTNNSDGERMSTSGIGFGPYIITNKHLFRSNNGELEVITQHGQFLVKNVTALQLHLIPDHDMLLIKMPKDFPPFPQRLKFRMPMREERVCLVSTNFQTKSLSSMVSESSVVVPMPNSTFWRHWISTKDGQCGLPLVATKDGFIVGIHCGSNVMTSNHFTHMPEKFQDILMSGATLDWVKGWKFNINAISWGNLKIKDSQPEDPFVTSKIIQDLVDETIVVQAQTQKWVHDTIEGNLRPVARSESQLVTKSVVKGKCQLFNLYLSTNEEAEKFFRPLMGEYMPSRLSKEAYLKDFMKYSSPIVVGDVNIKRFNKAVEQLIWMLTDKGFEENSYITDEFDIFNALNMKAAVGALYKGRKRDYFASSTPEDLANYLKESCKRLYTGQLGVWNGSLKSELRPIEKVNLNKTRSFTAAPVDTLLAGKVCVDDFNNQFYSLNLKAPWTVGMTKFFRGWDTLMRSLPEGWVYCYADGSQFDSSLSPYLLNSILQVRLHFMEDWDIGAEMLKNLYTEIVYTPILTPDGTIVKKNKGNNSGQPSTVVDNTLMVIIAMYYAMNSREIPMESVVFFVNGDDLLIAIEPKYQDELKYFQGLFLELGLKYGFDDITLRREDVEFMSHKAILRDGCYIPKLDKERIVSILEWDRSSEPTHRLEAICASMVESWGYDELTMNIRKFYLWVLSQAPYKQLAENGKAPYLAETALRKLYLNDEPTQDELLRYTDCIRGTFDDENIEEEIYLQADKLDAGASNQTGKNVEKKDNQDKTLAPRQNVDQVQNIDRDVDAGSSGTFSVPRLKAIPTKMNLPKVKGKQVINLKHLLQYKPEQYDLSNTRATHQQFSHWFDAVKSAYEVTDDQMQVLLNGLMVWCIENGTSGNLQGVWTMMDGAEQVEYSLKPIIENAQPTFRQIMAHFSDVAEAYIEMRNRDRAYMPRYGLQRNLTDLSLARYAFDFYELTSRTPVRAREAHMQMKAAAVRNDTNRLFGLDGNVGTTAEDTERHTAQDVNRGMHNLLGVRQG
ncbi:polyprotein [Tamarillo leaf malformation virus]|uniref:Genome polyprotein n=17 Tax=Tamarillo leaf malformation virus TaxID=945960 RepID=A0A0C5D5M9_9POTV|nr:polyprotein [Tamarillo leaf malformation virus]AJO62057.1 polyprotein [Tamarillo leaf malformation virus]